MSDRSVDPRTLAGDPFAYAGSKIPRRGHEECVTAMREEERLGRPLSQREREGFARGFHAPEYRMEIASLAARGLLDEEEEDS